MRKRVQILEVEQKISKKSSKPYWTCQCIVFGEQLKVGELSVFSPEMGAKLAKGEFYMDFDVRVSFERRLESELVGLTPVNTVVSESKAIPVAAPKA